jgi:hypothetical protein
MDSWKMHLICVPFAWLSILCMQVVASVEFFTFSPRNEAKMAEIDVLMLVKEAENSFSPHRVSVAFPGICNERNSSKKRDKRGIKILCVSVNNFCVQSGGERGMLQWLKWGNGNLFLCLSFSLRDSPLVRVFIERAGLAPHSDTSKN